MISTGDSLIVDIMDVKLMEAGSQAPKFRLGDLHSQILRSAKLQGPARV